MLAWWGEVDMQQDIKSLSSKIDAAMQLCKNVLEYGEKIRALSPTDIGMDAYAMELTQYTEDRGRATRIAIQELNAIANNYETMENDSAATSADKAFLSEKMRLVQDMSSLFAKQNIAIQKIIQVHLNSLRKESVEFHHNVGVIRNYLKSPDSRSFYG
jgi:DNA-directed RNA polymerase sigma subunit (sigma70/sigma32)